MIKTTTLFKLSQPTKRILAMSPNVTGSVKKMWVQAEAASKMKPKKGSDKDF